MVAPAAPLESLSLSSPPWFFFKVSRRRTFVLSSSGGPGVRCQHLSKLLLSKLFFMLFSYCYIINICILYIRSGVFVFVDSLSPSLYSLSFSSFTRLTLSMMVPLCELGPAQGFFLLKGSFSLPLCLTGCSGSGFLTL